MAYEDLLITQPDQGDGEPISDEWMAQVRDNFVELEPWTRDGGTYTPMWTGASGNGLPGSGGALDGWYQPVGPNLLFIGLRLLIGSSPTLPGLNWSFSLPVGFDPLAVAPYSIAGRARRAVGGYHMPVNAARSGIGVSGVAASGTADPYINNTTPWAWANGDLLEMAGFVLVAPS